MRLATYNLGDGPDRVKSHDLDDLAGMADVIVLQEASDRGTLLHHWADRRGWRYYAGDHSPGAAAVPILWRPSPDWRMTRLATHEAVDATNVGPAGAGPADIKRKVINRARFRLTVDGGRGGLGALVHVLNTHFIPGATRSELPNWADRQSHYRKHVRALCTVVETRDGAIAAGGDFNAPPTFDKLRPLRMHGMRQVVDGTTLHGVTVDHWWLRGLELVTTCVVDLSSDHRAAIAHIEPRRPA